MIEFSFVFLEEILAPGRLALTTVGLLCGVDVD